MDLSIIVINYKTKAVTADCLRSIKASTDKLAKEVIVVDNGSEDGSIEYLKKRFPWAKIYSSGGNIGFAGGNNFGFKRSAGKYVWLLNSDTVLQKTTVQKLYAAATANNSAIASCRLLNRDGSIQPQGGYLPQLWRLKAWMLFFDDLPIISWFFPAYHVNRKGYFKHDRYPGWLAGTALLIRRDVYKQLNGLDDRIFMYGEDVEFCLRAKKLGYRVDYFSAPALTHLGQVSGSSRGALLGEYKGLKYIYQKHFPRWQYWLLRVLLKTGAVLRRIIFRNEIYGEAFKLA
jgi:GT2 family glycosyltransferase